MKDKTHLTISDDLFRQLSELPDNRHAYNISKQKEIEAAVMQFYPQKSISGIARILGVSEKAVKKIAEQLGKK